jgi:hypothetical protein
MKKRRLFITIVCTLLLAAGMSTAEALALSQRQTAPVSEQHAFGSDEILVPGSNITVEASDTVYNGKAHPVSVSSTLDAKYLIDYDPNLAGTVDYSTVKDKIDKEAILVKYRKSDDTELSTEAPVDAGTYVAKVQVGLFYQESNGGAGKVVTCWNLDLINTNSHCVEVEFTIDPKPVAVNWTDTQKTYNGKNQTPESELSGVCSGDTSKVSVACINGDGTAFEKKDAGSYKVCATLAGEKASNYTIDSGIRTNFTIAPKPLSIAWKTAADGEEFDTEITYDGQNHLPVPIIGGVAYGDQINAKAADKSGKAYDSGDKAHINHGKYTVYAKTAAGAGTRMDNYTVQYSPLTYTIGKRTVQLDWYRPVYDNDTGEPCKSDGAVQLQKVKEDETIGLVYNATEQKPAVTIGNLVTRADTGNLDNVKVVVDIREGKKALEVGKYNITAAELSGSGASNYTLEDAGDRARELEIVKRPVSLEWGYKETADSDPKYKTVFSKKSNGYDYITTYNGEKQEPVVTIKNLPLDEDGDEDYNRVKVVVDSKAGCDRADSAEPEREFTDAGVYALHAGTMYDKRNYSYYKLEQENESGRIGVSSEQVDNFNANYTIEQQIAVLKWTPENASFEYDGKEHKPAATIGNIQKSAEGIDDSYELTYRVEKKKSQAAYEKSSTSENAGDYRITVASVSNKNYTLIKGTGTDKDTAVDNISKEYVISRIAPAFTAPKSNTLTYSGQDQALVAAGEASGGTMQYAKGENGETAPTEGWSEEIPKGTDSGTYYVWYKVVGDENHSDTEAACVEVTVSPVDKGDLNKSIAEAQKRSVTTVTVNTKTVSADAVNTAVTKAGGSSEYVTTIVLGKKVKIISKSAFKNYKNAKTLVVKTKKLKRAKVKKSLKDSEITNVKVQVGKKKTNKKYVKRYKRIFTKKNAGKKVIVSA